MSFLGDGDLFPLSVKKQYFQVFHQQEIKRYWFLIQVKGLVVIVRKFFKVLVSPMIYFIGGLLQAKGVVVEEVNVSTFFLQFKQLEHLAVAVN